VNFLGLYWITLFRSILRRRAFISESKSDSGVSAPYDKGLFSSLRSTSCRVVVGGSGVILAEGSITGITVGSDVILDYETVSIW
jgi:hypothetical protein